MIIIAGFFHLFFITKFVALDGPINEIYGAFLFYCSTLLGMNAL